MVVKVFCLVFLLNSWAFANVGGSDMQNFNPTTSGLGFISVHSSQVLESGQFNFGSFFNYATNSLAYSTLSVAPNGQTFSEPNDRLLYSQLHLGVGLIRGWDIGLSAGFINSQDIKQSNFLFSYGDTGINDVRLNSKVRVFKTDNFGLAGIVTVDFDQIKNNPFVGDNAGPIINFEGAADIEFSQGFRWAINLGYRFRQEGTPIPNTGVIPLSDQWLYSSALSYQTDDFGSAVIGEIYGSAPLEQTSTPTDRALSNLEALIGYRWRGLKDVDLHGGFGTEIYHGLGSPDFRFYLGVNWRLSFISQEPPQKTENNDLDQDGVPDPIDQCPETTSPYAKVDERGCEPGQQQTTESQ